MKSLYFGFCLFIFSVTFAQEYAFHPAPKDPQFLAKSDYSFFKTKITLPPKKSSAEQQKDVTELLQLQNSRTEADCTQAKKEVHAGVIEFLGEESHLIPSQAKTEFINFFEQIRNDVDFFVQKLKVDFPRERPFLYIKDLKPCIPKEVTKSYPSGHSAISAAYALVLSDLFPDKKDFFENRAKSIRDHRVLAGVHHRSDVVSGKELAQLVYNKMKENSAYKLEYKKLKEKAVGASKP